MISLDKGAFAAKAITIEPCANGSYLVTTRAELYGTPLISQSVAFSNWRDLVAFLSEDYAAANASPSDASGAAQDAAHEWMRRAYPDILGRCERGEMSFASAYAEALQHAIEADKAIGRDKP